MNGREKLIMILEKNNNKKNCIDPRTPAGWMMESVITVMRKMLKEKIRMVDNF